MKMRKWLLGIIAVIALVGVCFAAQVTFSFTYDFSAATGDPACSTTLTSNCVKQFKLYHLDNQANMVQDQIIPLPSPPPTGNAVEFTVVQKVGPPYGNIVYGIVAQAVGNDGTTIVESGPLTITVTGKPSPPKSLVIP